MRMVLTVPVELDELDEELEELEELEPCGGGHGGIATVCTSVPFGTMIVVDPAGGFAVGRAVPTPPEGWLPLAAGVPPCGHGGMLIWMSFRCFASRTVRTPGVWRAVATGSVDEELLLELELPHATTAAASATSVAAPTKVRAIRLLQSAIQLPLLARVPVVTGGVPNHVRARNGSRVPLSA
jgi:hypothetical protein